MTVLAAALFLAGCSAHPRLGSMPSADAKISPANFVPPDGCTLLATVSQQSCSVAQVIRCDGQPGRIEHQFIDSKLASAVEYRRGLLVTGIYKRGRDQVSLFDYHDHSEFDGVDFATSWSIELSGVEFTKYGDGRNQSRSYTDLWTSVPTTTEIDNETIWVFDRISTFDHSDGAAVWRGRVFFHPGLGAVVGQQATADHVGRTGRRPQIDLSPVAIAKPGDQGFGSVVPGTDCPAGRPSDVDQEGLT
ncbi:MAG: hypothetical protein AAF409_09070 [Pseudomonadota bacterium]